MPFWDLEGMLVKNHNFNLFIALKYCLTALLGFLTIP